MANRFWVTGGNENWNSTTNWSTSTGGASGASVPGSSDAAIFDASSGAGTAVLDISPTIQTLNCSGFTGTLAFGTNTISLNSTGTIFTGSTTMTVTGTPQIICTNSSATSRTISPQVVTEANSISFNVIAGTGSFTITSTHAVRSLDFTDGVNPTGFAGAFGNTSSTIYGNLKASTGMTRSAGGTLTFAATSGTQQITTNAIAFDCAITQNGVGGTVQLQDNLTMGSTRAFTLTAGTLDLSSGNRTLSCGIFSSSNSNTRTITFGTGNITVTGNGATILTFATVTGLTITGTPVVNCTYAGATGTRIINTGAIPETQTISVNVTAGTDIFSIGGSGGSLKDVDLTGFSGTFTLSSGKNIFGNLTVGATVASWTAGASPITFTATSGTKTITTNNITVGSSFIFNGIGGAWSFADALTQESTRTFRITEGTVSLKSSATSTVGIFSTTGTSQKYLQSTTPGSQATLSQASGTVNASYLTIKDINATGGATWNAFVDQNNVDAGNVDGWNFGISPVVGGAEYTYSMRSFTQPRRF
jgi:hypothetical protein